MMKIVTNFAIAFVTLMLAGFVGPHQSVMAADDLGPKKSSAQLTVDAGNIMIQQVPDLNFGGISVHEIVSGSFQRHPLKSNLVNPGPIKTATNANDGNATGLLQIADYRGTGAGWRLEAKMDALTDGKGHFLAGYVDLVGSQLTASNPDINPINPAGSNVPRLNFAKDDTSVSSTVVWQADAETGTKSGQGQGNNQTTIGTRTALTLVATNTNVTIAKGRYQGAITWTLSNAPKG